MKTYEEKHMICHDSRKCFARRTRKGVHYCTILCKIAHTLDVGGVHCTSKENMYLDGECPFAKPRMDITKGKKYPIGDLYMPAWVEADKAKKREERKKRDARKKPSSKA